MSARIDRHHAANATELDDRARPGETLHREGAHRDTRRNLVEETATPVEAGEVRSEARLIEPLGELDHLPFGPPDVEAREQEDDVETLRHAHI